MVRTSKSDPICFNEVECGGGILGLTFCPGKSGPSVFGDDWARDLGADLDAARAWGAATVLTLVETHELDMLRVADLGTEVEARGMNWLHAPIVDLSAPDDQFERRWLVIGHLARASLRRGERVVVHCRGGRGRAGTIAARLLVEFGAESGAAIERVRQARPGTIETVEQERHVRDCAPVVSDPVLVDRILGCLFGGAVGDGFGYAIEFDRLAEIRRLYGAGGLQAPKLTDGKLVVSDDTQMTLFTASALAGASDPEEAVAAIRLAYLDWYRTQTQRWPTEADQGLAVRPELWAQRAPGLTCMSALAAGGHGTPTARSNDSKGCGGVMRVAPIGLMTQWTEEQVVEVAARAAAITHGHPTGFWSAAAAALMVRVMVDGRSFDDALAAVARFLAPALEANETLRAIISAFATPRDLRWRDVEEGRLGEGWVGEEALAIALYSVTASDDFKDVMRIAANHDGDSDSTASIAGQLFGVRHGLSRIPWSWVAKLDVFNALCEVGEAHLEACDREQGQIVGGLN